MKLVEHILREKGGDCVTVDPSTTVFEAVKLMSEKGIGAVLVTENNGLCGIMSERDYARKIILVGKASKEAQVREIMTSDVLYVSPNNTVEDCMALMTRKHLRHLPVLENGELCGMISIGDVVKAIMDHQEFTINQLENYIHGHA